jgi:hypothetical protein
MVVNGGVWLMVVLVYCPNASLADRLLAEQ